MQVKVMEPVSLEGKNLVMRINEYTQQEQYRTKELMEMLRKMIPHDAYCICGITFHEGLYSFARYDPAFFGEEREKDYQKMKLLRTVKVMTHEICHQFGMSHCIYYNCLMNGSNHQEESDRRPPHECPVCLRKLQFAIGFDIEERYKNLMAWFKKHGYQDEVSWMEERIKILSDNNPNASSNSNNNSVETHEMDTAV